MTSAFTPLTVLLAAMFTLAPVLIIGAPYESSMGLVQKIFYFHFASWMGMFAATIVCGVASARVLFQRRAASDITAVSAAELVVVFGIIGLITGPLWGRKAWGVWWTWDGRATSALVLWLIFVSYLLLRRFGGPGSERLSAAIGLFGMFNVPFVYWSVNLWRTIHPLTSVVPTLPVNMGIPLYFCWTAFMILFVALMLIRVRLEHARTRLEEAYLAVDD